MACDDREHQAEAREKVRETNAGTRCTGPRRACSVGLLLGPGSRRTRAGMRRSKRQTVSTLLGTQRSKRQTVRPWSWLVRNCHQAHFSSRAHTAPGPKETLRLGLLAWRLWDRVYVQAAFWRERPHLDLWDSNSNRWSPRSDISTLATGAGENEARCLQPRSGEHHART